MNNYYFIANKKEYVLIIAESQQMAETIFKMVSLYNNCKAVFSTSKPEFGKQVEQIKQRQTN